MTNNRPINTFRATARRDAKLAAEWWRDDPERAIRWLYFQSHGLAMDECKRLIDFYRAYLP